MKKGIMVLYRGQKYKVMETKTMDVDGNGIPMVRLNHKKYGLWVNQEYLIEC